MDLFYDHTTTYVRGNILLLSMILGKSPCFGLFWLILEQIEGSWILGLLKILLKILENAEEMTSSSILELLEGYLILGKMLKMLMLKLLFVALDWYLIGK